MGADVTVVDARDRVGGRVFTVRDGFKEQQHAEAGGDMIDEAQHEIRGLCKDLGLTYHCDYMTDEQAYLINTAHGPLVSTPYT